MDSFRFKPVAIQSSVIVNRGNVVFFSDMVIMEMVFSMFQPYQVPSSFLYLIVQQQNVELFCVHMFFFCCWRYKAQVLQIKQVGTFSKKNFFNYSICEFRQGSVGIIFNKSFLLFTYIYMVVRTRLCVFRMITKYISSQLVL